MSNMKWLMGLGAAGLAGFTIAGQVAQRNIRRTIEESLSPDVHFPTWAKPTPIPAPWAILLCKFKGDDSEPYPRDYYEDLFTASGIGSMNMVDFFRDMSHGKIDLRGSRVFGWLQLDNERSEYHNKREERPILFGWARTAAVAAGIDLSPYSGILAITNVDSDEFGGLFGALVSGSRVEPRVVGQEMLHTYGLCHSHILGSDAPYMDPWDVMSTRNGAQSAPHKRYGWIGPGLNAANMALLHWLDERRVWQTTGRSFDKTVTLRPLHRADLSGYLAARIADLLVEFRVKAGWDAGIDRPMVLIHRANEAGMWSELFPANNGRPMMVTGSVYGYVGARSGVRALLTRQLGVQVLEINEDEQWATVRLVLRPAIKIPQLAPGRVLGGVAAGGGGIVIVGRKIVRIPPRSPLVQLVDQAAIYEDSQAIPDPALREAVRRRSLLAMRSLTQQELARSQETSSPAPEVEE